MGPFLVVAGAILLAAAMVAFALIARGRERRNGRTDSDDDDAVISTLYVE